MSTGLVTEHSQACLNVGLLAADLKARYGIVIQKMKRQEYPTHSRYDSMYVVWLLLVKSYAWRKARLSAAVGIDHGKAHHGHPEARQSKRR